MLGRVVKALEEKRDKLIDKLCDQHDISMIKGFNLGWNACIKEFYQKQAELELLREMLEVEGLDLSGIEQNYTDAVVKILKMKE